MLIDSQHVTNLLYKEHRLPSLGVKHLVRASHLQQPINKQDQQVKMNVNLRCRLKKNLKIDHCMKNQTLVDLAHTVLNRCSRLPSEVRVVSKM